VSNSGSLTVTTTLTADIGKIDNAAGTLTVHDDATLSDFSTLTNEAGLTVDGNAKVQSSSTFTNTGTGEVGSLSVLTGGQVTNAATGALTIDATATVKRLADRGLVDHTPYRGVALTAPGSRAAVSAIRRHRIVERFLAAIRHGERGSASDRAAATAAGVIPQFSAIAAAASALLTCCSP